MFKKKLLLFFISVMLIFNLGVNSPRSLIYYVKGVKALSKKEYPEAIEQLRKALELSPESGKARKALATALNNYAQSFENMKREKSLELMEEAVGILPEEQRLRKNLAEAYNNRGVAFYQKKEFDKAVKKYEKAIAFNPTEGIYQRNLGAALAERGTHYFRKGEFNKAILKYTTALQYITDNQNLWRMLGEAYYKLDDLEKTINCWEEAKKISSTQHFLSEKLTKVKTEWLVRKDFNEFNSGYFKIKFSPDFSRDKAYEVYNYVKEAIWSVGRDLGQCPKEKFSVFVYQADEFEKITSAKKHIAGFYDGKIHLKINEGSLPEEIAELVKHEYTHAVVFWLTEGKCPLWFNEGLACYEEKKDREIDFRELKALARQNKLIPLSNLSLQCEQLADLKDTSLAYKEAHNIITYIIDEYGLWMVRKMLGLFGEGKEEMEVIKESLRITKDRLEEEWKESLFYE